MVSFIFWLAVISAGIGLGLKFVLDRGVLDETYPEFRVTWVEYLIGVVVTTAVIVPLVAVVGWRVAKANLLEFNEYWNGYEVEAVKHETSCSRDGSCRWHYDCDPYQVPVTRTRSVPDGNGGTRTETYVEIETRYHSCPYATVEWSFTVRTTLEDFDLGRTIPADAARWRQGRAIPDSIPRGEPVLWVEARDRIAAGDPGPVTVVRRYDNYVLASQNSIIKEFSDSVDLYLEQELLPSPAMVDGVHNHYYANKAFFVEGVPNPDEWSFAVGRFNAAFGTELQGDLHVVFVTEGVDPDDYVGALNAYWTSDVHGDDALSKNALVVVFGTDGERVVWTRAFTGMPLGNELFLQRIENATEGLVLDPGVVLGRPVGSVDDEGDVTVAHGDGVVENAAWGEPGFVRVCMTCDDTGESGGFGYLSDEIQPTGGHKRAIGAVALVLSVVLWCVFGFVLNGKAARRCRSRLGGPDRRVVC